MSLPKVVIDDASGFCFGVVNAIAKAEEQLAQGPLYCLGDIVHNSDEVKRLEAKGLVTISHSQLATLGKTRVMLRAHGEPPSTYAVAKNNSIEIIDATCPVVLQLQRRIKQAYELIRGLDILKRPQIVIYGKTGHAEVNGLVGQTDGNAIVIENEEHVERLDFTRDIWLYSQTTKPQEGLKSLVELLKNKIKAPSTVTAYDTTCRQVSGRSEHLRRFAASHDVVIFVCGSKSSNGRVLFAECLSANPESHMVSDISQLVPDWFAADISSIGICGATSTPMWLMEKVRDYIIHIIETSRK